MTKKGKFLTAALLLTFLLTLTPDLSIKYGAGVLVFFSLVGLLLALVCLWSDLKGLEFITLLSLPALFCLGMASILFNFPNFSLVFRAAFYTIFFIFYYSLLLALNVFNVATERLIPLLRAACTVSFIITVFSTLPLFTLIYKLYPEILTGSLLVFFLGGLLSFQSFWTIFLPLRQDKAAFRSSLILSLVLAETALVFSFFPLESFFRSLILSTFFYICLGFGHQHLRKHLTARHVFEYSTVGLIIIALVIFY